MSYNFITNEKILRLSLRLLLRFAQDDSSGQALSITFVILSEAKEQAEQR